jgi:hypothetical protein
MMRRAALNSGPDFHLLDHIAPLAELLHMPLITDEKLNDDLARLYYPQIETRYMPDLKTRLSDIAEEYDALFECKYWMPQTKALFRQLYNKEMRCIFCPHGQSDKGFRSPLLAPYAWQDIVLLYGDLLIQMLKDLGIWPSISQYAVTGNYRLRFYQKYRSFYDGLVEKKIPINKRNRTLLYAPTWRDADAATSFFRHGSEVITQLPSDWNLILKLHPLLEQRDPAHFYSITALTDNKPNAWVVHEFPPVYPLLARSDVYLGDSSSVGYDFLYFQRPLYFFPTDHSGKLHSCGRFIEKSKNIYSQIDKANPCEKEQRSLYELAFGLQESSEHLRKQIDRILARARQI